MNIFVLDKDPFVAAELHCDKHVVKMIVEYAQLLSTAHRMLDGKRETHIGPNSKARTFYLLPGERVVEREIITEFVLDEEAREIASTHKHRMVIENPACYNATHTNHPCALWARETGPNYYWLLRLLVGCLKEYTHRYSKTHATDAMLSFFRHPPKNMKHGELTPFPQAMPAQFQVSNDPIAAYQAFYVGSKSRFAKWTNRSVPEWFATAIIKEGRDVSKFQRTR